MIRKNNKAPFNASMSRESVKKARMLAAENDYSCTSEAFERSLDALLRLRDAEQRRAAITEAAQTANITLNAAQLNLFSDILFEKLTEKQAV